MTSTSRSNNAHIYFWLMGLLNNVSYTIMLAGAKEISDGGTALVYLANILPTLVVKVTSPFWFYRVSYTSRIISGACLFFLSFLIVAYFSTIHVGSNEKTNLELVGISFGSFGSGMGEATLLAYAGKLNFEFFIDMSFLSLTFDYLCNTKEKYVEEGVFLRMRQVQEHLVCLDFYILLLCATG